MAPECTFERLFTGLAETLGLERPTSGVRRGPIQPTEPSEVSAGAQTIDDLMASVVAIAHPGGQKALTGFVLSQPRVIVTDGYGGNIPFTANQATIVTSDNRRFDVAAIRREKSHPFGPLILEVPEELKVAGLVLDPKSPERGVSVRVGVAAGERVGISSGVIADPSQRRIEIAPIGRVEHLVAVECVTAPGASGAPVVDSSLAVRGFIVAGRTDGPPSYMYPANRWADALEGKTGRRRNRGPRRKRGIR